MPGKHIEERDIVARGRREGIFEHVNEEIDGGYHG